METKLEIVYLPLDALTPYDKNARKHKEGDVKVIVESIRQFGFNDPIGIWGNRNIIVEGHGRLLAARELGLTEVPCIRLDSLTDEQRKAYALTHNRSAELSEWDMDNLDDELRALEEEFDLDALGFTALLNLDEEPVEVKDDDFDEDLFAPEEPETKPGDIYILGRHKLICGDSTVKSTFFDLLEKDGEEEKFDLILTDPPYNVDYVGKTAEALKIKNDKKTRSEFFDFLLKSFINMYAAAKEGCPCFVFHADKEEVNFRESYEEAGFKWHQNAIWEKDTFVMGHAWMHYRYEPILIGWKEGAAHFDKGDRTIDNILKFDRPKRSLEHPTMKPLDLIGWLLDFGSPKNAIVLDPFGGSGSTLIACEQANRSCRTVELDPKYCDVIVKRYVRYIGNVNDCYLIRNGEKTPLDNTKIVDIVLL